MKVLFMYRPLSPAIHVDRHPRSPERGGKTAAARYREPTLVSCRLGMTAVSAVRIFLVRRGQLDQRARVVLGIECDAGLLDEHKRER